MSAALHILRGDDHIAAFDLQPGSHLLGIGEDADLVLSDQHAKNDLCYVEVTPEHQVTLLALPNVPLRSPSGESAPEMIVANGRFVEVSDLTITLLRTPDLGDVQVDPPRSLPLTTKSPFVHAPPADNLALLVTTTRNAKVVEIDRPRITIGREMGNTVRIAHEQVSAWHAEVVQKADGLWLNDLTSSNGTFLNGTIFRSGAIPKGGRIHLSPASDAPVLELLTRAEAVARTSRRGALLALVGSHPSMVRCREQLARYASLDSPVLILGETGTGKELMARVLAEGRGIDKPYVAFNCGDLERQLIGSELFGHVKGAFTGAIRDRMGYAETAAHGTLFMDEIGELPLDLQALLLRMIENRTIQRRGESRERDVHCRFIAATHRDLPRWVAEKRFREDLFHRLNTFVVIAPTLRERLVDLPEISAVLLGRLHGDGEGKVLSHAALQRLGDHDWPGNVRELANVLQRAAVHTQGIEIPPEQIAFGHDTSKASAVSADAEETFANATARRRLAERMLCQKALAEANGSIRQAAKSLCTSNTSFRRRLKNLGILTPAQTEESADSETV